MNLRLVEQIGRLAGVLAFVLFLGAAPAQGQESPRAAAELLERFCFECHQGDSAEAGVDLSALAANRTFGEQFPKWRKAAAQITAKSMPPPDAEQPDSKQRAKLAAAISRGLRAAAELHEGDPGRVVMRRLTSAEYTYTIGDLTGLQIDFSNMLSGDAVGGAGFTNTGIAQFTQEATLERYLEAARRVGEHAVIGAGPLTFHQDPGQTGFELSAITRIQAIYRRHGFRTASGEGGQAFGLDKYSRAFYAAWRYHHRAAAGTPDAAFAVFAKDERVDARFVEFIYRVVTQREPSFPLSEIVDQWRALPVLDGDAPDQLTAARLACDRLGERVQQWQRRFGANVDSKEEAPVLREDLFDVRREQPFEMNVNWPDGTTTAHLFMAVESAIRGAKPNAVVIWRDASIQFRIADKELVDAQPLRRFVTEKTMERMGFGKHPRGGRLADNDFATILGKSPTIEIPIPKGAGSARLFVTAELDTKLGEDCIARCSIAQLEETDQGKSVSGLLANPDSKAFVRWKQGVLDFARHLPQVSHREPAPSDRDPIPPPVDPTYNNAERNLYHTRIKYHRDDRYLVANILDDDTRRRLDHAWADLLGSFEFHDAWLQFLSRKYELKLGDQQIVDLEQPFLAGIPPEPRQYIQKLQVSYAETQLAFGAAESGHVDDVARFAGLAWRRPVSAAETDSLREFYSELREQELDHRSAIRTLLVRTLMAPQFLYRAEDGAASTARPLSDWELASRLSYFLWSSPPDAELRRAAAAGELIDPENLEAQARRMLRDPRARRLATEFFGQWFGFYRFDRHRSVDAGRFPEFTDAVKSAMYDESIDFFDHIVRNDRPLSDVLFADFTIVNRDLADHYGVDVEFPKGVEKLRIEKAREHHRGGLLRLGAILTVTSAPLRTSPVKRGDWVLRRALGAPVPPPPPDAGSIAGDDVTADGKSIQERLEIHRRDPSCRNCHSRIDPLGFALEQFDAVGRFRERYRDGAEIDTAGELRDGSRIRGLDDLEAYLRRHIDLFYRTLSVKLLAYSLGRGEAIGDDRLLNQMTAELQKGGGIAVLVNHIVRSRQFRYHGESSGGG
ncbi:MAG: DUF1592 domain-containing protein [Pirellulaceae bacterium]|jgi:hypothetical protein|nr:DUF1592 domain-containing protein [Pirellulaceae bacterium]MDP7015503.1 DUF1592 domain-containing protein [Pirellulaceae bacterium]